MNVRFRGNAIVVRGHEAGPYYYWDTTRTKAFEIMARRPTFTMEGLSGVISATGIQERVLSHELLKHAILNTTQQLLWRFSPSEQERISERLCALHQGIAFLEALN